MATCKACGARIVWIRSSGGKQIPCDEKMVTFRKEKGATGKFVTKDGNVVSGELVENLASCTNACVGYTSHFATCSEPQRFRQK